VRQLTIGTVRVNRPPSVALDKGDQSTESRGRGDLLLAVPPRALGRLVSPEVAARAPMLEKVRLLRVGAMISLDLYFKRNIPG